MSKRKFRPARMILLSACAAVALTPVAASAQAGGPVQYRIEAQDLGTALTELARQSKREIYFSSDLTRGRRAPSVSGQLTVEQALGRLLQGSGLSYRINSTGAIAIVSTGGNGGAAAEMASSKGEDASASPEAQNENPEQQAIVVTGTNIHGNANTGHNLIVINRDEIISTGLSTTTSLLQSLPQNFALNNQSGVRTPGTTSTAEQGSGVDLRGIGEGTTLVLLNGHRMAPGFFGSAVDISALPLSAIDRVEILTDGASAIYGADAVGGVVNFILRHNFNGAETSVRAGTADGGINEYDVSQTLGHVWSTGNALISLDYYKRDLLPADKRDFVPANSLVGSLLPGDKDYSATFSGRQKLLPSVSIFSDIMFTHRNSFNEGAITTNPFNNTTNSQLSSTAGVDWRPIGDWQIEASGSYANNNLHRLSNFGTTTTRYHTLYDIYDLELKADGSLLRLPGGLLRAAVGADWRSESIDSTATGFAAIDRNQTVRSAFAELHLPVFGTTNAVPGIRSLDLSIAGRLDDYSRFGSAFSPQLGADWQIADGFHLRGSYGKSYRAPRLIDYDPTNNSATVFSGIPDPGSPTGKSVELTVTGTAVNELKAQRSNNLSAGFEFKPPSIRGLVITGNYYKITYHGEIAAPPSPSVILANPLSFGSLIIRNPTVAQVNEYIGFGTIGGKPFTAFNYPSFTKIANFDPSSVTVIVDRRTQNLSVVQTSGLDFAVNYAFLLGLQKLRLGIDGTYVINRLQQVTATSAPFDSVNTFYNPPHFRARASIGWERSDLSANVFVNYTGEYTDNRISPFVPVPSYTTVDLRIAYNLPGGRSGLFGGVRLALNIQNLFDRDPPSTRLVTADTDMGFDPTNASPLGRLVSVELVKQW